MATEIAEGEIYGTALERAYLLESKRAKYPRIVIGEELWRYLSVALVEFEKRGTPGGKALKAIVQKMMQLVSTDTDGERMLDYMGTGIAEPMKPGEAKTMVQPAYDFVVDGQERLLSMDDRKLGRRTISTFAPVF